MVARQSIGAIFNMAASFQGPEDAVDVQATALDRTAGTPDEHLSDGWSHVFDRRTVGERHHRDDDGRARAWMRMADPVADDPLTQACALAYLSDDLPTEAVVNHHPARHGIGSEDEGDQRFMSASLDHAIWFHRRIDAAEWHLHDMRNRGLTGSRGLAIGDIFAADGTHAATLSQEVLLRVRR